ncbi:c-type cytochrome [Oceanisphaera avium]|uniref:Cytochrome c-551 n=1 Tax=Oceanisphaera avium TaxID=1903694 RepID=A0A1Y0CZE4_9GAMM|nr:c-type cytochrome [Oceanisphaera avium]ART80693.1 cytochrome C biogenesis protein CcsA [Oceanisphaera avium]
MKKVLLPIAVLSLAVSFGSLANEGEAIFKSNSCVGCHTVDSQLVGPALSAVAERYADDENAVETLADHIKNGSQGRWGSAMPMGPNAVTEEEATSLAQWIVTL